METRSLTSFRKILGMTFKMIRNDKYLNELRLEPILLREI